MHEDEFQRTADAAIAALESAMLSFGNSAPGGEREAALAVMDKAAAEMKRIVDHRVANPPIVQFKRPPQK